MAVVFSARTKTFAGYIVDCESINEWMFNEVLRDGVVRVPRLLDVNEQVTLQYVSAFLVFL